MVDFCQLYSRKTSRDDKRFPFSDRDLVRLSLHRTTACLRVLCSRPNLVVGSYFPKKPCYNFSWPLVPFHVQFGLDPVFLFLCPACSSNILTAGLPSSSGTHDAYSISRLRPRMTYCFASFLQARYPDTYRPLRVCRLFLRTNHTFGLSESLLTFGEVLSEDSTA